jgi:hypothetical protein
MSDAMVNLVDLLAQMRRDEQQDEATLRERDRAIGRALASSDSRAKVLGWLEALRGPRPSTGRRAAQAVRVITLALAVLGAALGYGAAAAVFHYDGSRPVNVVHVLAAFVFAPLLLLAMTLLVLLPRGWARFVPGLASAQETLAMLSPAHLGRLLARALPEQHRIALGSAAGRTRAHQAVFGQVHKWLFLSWSQTFAASFFAGALAGCVGLVVVSDLAFGWSTTLRVGAQDFYRLTQAVAWPWSWLWPEAAPSAQLVLDTQYFRFGGGTLGGDDVPALGDWWPFLVMAIACYALLPRLVTLTVARVRLRQSVNQTLLRVPGVHALLDRLSSELVQTAGESEELDEDAPAVPPDPAPGSGAESATLRGRRCVVIDWSSAAGSPEAAQRVAVGVSVAQTLRAGGSASVQDDAQTARQAAALTTGEGDSVVVLVRAWEPPLLELLDFLRDLRVLLGPGKAITVVARGQDGDPHPHDLAVWSRRLQRLGDPWVTLRAATEGQP